MRATVERDRSQAESPADSIRVFQTEDACGDVISRHRLPTAVRISDSVDYAAIVCFANAWQIPKRHAHRGFPAPGIDSVLLAEVCSMEEKRCPRNSDFDLPTNVMVVV
jgi:hypothetical protein